MSSYSMNFPNNNREFQMIEYDNGYYQGEIINSKREGFGVFYWDSGQVYLGKWCKDQMEDEGVVYFSEGGCAYGNFRRNKLSGYACVLDPNDNMIVGHFTKGILESGVWNEKSSGKWYRYDVQMSEPNRDYELTTKSTIPQVVTLKEVIKKIFHECQGRRCVKYIEYLDTTFYVGVTNDNGRSPAGLGVMHDADNKLMQVGYFKGKKLNGFGRQYLGFMINDGIFEHQEFKYGTQFFVRDKKFFYGFFNGNQIKKIIKSGTGYPSYLLGYYKHPSKYANAKIDKVQDLEVMQDLQNQFLSKYQSFGYSEIYKNSPKKKNLLLFVENKFSEDFISPSCSIYQEVLEATQYSRSQNANLSHSPMRKKGLYLQDEDNPSSHKQMNSKISPSSQSSYTPSNIRLKQSNQDLRKSKDMYNSTTDKKKSKSTDEKQKQFFSTQKKQQNKIKDSQQSSKYDSQHIFIQDGSNQSIDSQNVRDSLSQYQIKHPQRKRNQSKNSVESSGSQKGRVQLKKQNQLDDYAIKINGESDDFSHKRQNQDGSSNIPNIAQNAMNQFKKNSITSTLSNKSNQQFKQNSVSSSIHKSSISQSIQIGDDQNEQMFQPMNTNDEDMIINQYQQRDETDRKASFLSNVQSQQFQQNSLKTSKKYMQDDNLNLNQLDDELKQIQQLQDLLQSFNGANQSLNKKIRESISTPQNNSIEGSNQPKNQLLNGNNATRNSLLKNQFGSHQQDNQLTNSSQLEGNTHYRNTMPDDQLINVVQENIHQRFSEQFGENIPNTLAPDQKLESTSRQLSTERYIEESSHTNDRRKHETPRFDLINGILQNNQYENIDDVKRSKSKTQQKILSELENSYQNAASEVNNLYRDMQNELNNLKNENQQDQQYELDQQKNKQFNNRHQQLEQNLTNNTYLTNSTDVNNTINKPIQPDNYKSISSNYSQNERLKSQSINSQSTYEHLQNKSNTMNNNAERNENNQQRSSIYSINSKQFDYKINIPSYSNQNTSTQFQDNQDDQEDIIEKIKRLRNQTEDNKARPRVDSYQSQNTQLSNQYQSIQSQQQQFNEQQNTEINQNKIQQHQLKQQQYENYLKEQNGQLFNRGNEDNQRRNSYEMRDRLESIQLPVTPVNMLQQSPQGYSYYDRRGSNNISDLSLNKQTDHIQLDGIKHEDSIHQSEQLNQQIVQRLNTLNKDKDKLKREQNDSFECNIYQESQPDFVDSQVQNHRNEDYYKSQMQTIPENKELDSTKNSQIRNQKVNQKPNFESRIKSLSISNDNFQPVMNNASIHKQNQNLNGQYNNQLTQLDPSQNNQSRYNFNQQQFQQFNNNKVYQRQRDDLNTTLDDENEEAKTKFKYINQSPSKPNLSQSSTHIKKRRKIFDTPLNNSFTTTSPTMSRYGTSPISQQMNVIMPTNNDQKISEFNINNMMVNYNQNKQEYTPSELNEIQKFKREKNMKFNTNSFDQMNVSENQLIFTNPQLQEYSTQSTNNNFNSNLTPNRFKSNNSNQFQQTNQQSNLQHSSNQQQLNQNQSQSQQKIPNHQRIYSQHDYNSYNSNSSQFDGFNNRLSTLPNNFDSRIRQSQENNIQPFNQFNQQINSKSQIINPMITTDSRTRQNYENQPLSQLSSESRIRLAVDKQIAQQLQPNYNNSGSNSKSDVRSLRQIMNVSIDKGQNSQTQGFFSQNGLQSNKASFFTNSGCEPVQSFKFQSNQDNKEQYNSLRCTFSKNLQQSLSELNDQNQSFASSAHNTQFNTQNDLYYDEENNRNYLSKAKFESRQKQSTQFQPVMKSQSQSKENNTQNPQFTHKSRPNKFNLNINLADISNDKLTPEKINIKQTPTPSSQKTISLSKISKINDQRRNEGILDQFMSVKSNLKNQFQSVSSQQPSEQQYFTKSSNFNL